jgi:hypothetical protein
MPIVTAETQLPATATEVWRHIGRFDAVRAWHPGVESSRLEDGGAVRRLTLADGGATVERLVSHDDVNRSYTYEFLEGSLPVRDYEATLAVDHDPDGSATVRWSSRFTAAGASEAEAAAMIRAFLEAGLDNLHEVFASAERPEAAPTRETEPAGLSAGDGGKPGE